MNDAYIMHVCGDVKVNELPLCAWEAHGSARSPMCGSRALRVAQDMLLEAQPCVWHNHDNTGHACAAAEGCGWCGFQMGCTANQQCYMDSNATQAMIRRVTTAPGNTANKWSILSDSNPDQFAAAVPDLWSTLVSVVVLSCNRLPFLLLALDQIEKNRKVDNPSNFAVTLEVVIVDDSPKDSDAGRRLLTELRQRYDRMQVLDEEDVPGWDYPNRTITLENGEVLTMPQAKGHGQTSEYNSILYGSYGARRMIVRVVRSRERRTIGAKRTLGARAARGHVIQHWDDDDLLPPGALWQNVRALAQGVTEVVTNAFDWMFVVPSGEYWRVHPDRCIGGLGSMAYLRSVAADINGFSNNSLSEDIDFVERALQRCHRFFIRDCYDRERSGYVYTRHGSITGRYSDLRGVVGHGGTPPRSGSSGAAAPGQDSTWSWDNGIPDYLPMTRAPRPPEWLADDLRWRYAEAERQTVALGQACTAPNHTTLEEPTAMRNRTGNTHPRMPSHCCAAPLDGNVDDGCWTRAIHRDTFDGGESGFGHYTGAWLSEQRINHGV